MNEFSLVERDFSISATTLKASTSSHESISSRMMYFGFRSFIWRISSFLRSPQLNPTFKSLHKKSLESWSSSRIGSMIFLNSINVVVLTALSYTHFKNSKSLIHGISGMFWNARNIPSLALLSVDKSDNFCQSKTISPSVIWYFGCHISVIANEDFQLPFFQSMQ